MNRNVNQKKFSFIVFPVILLIFLLLIPLNLYGAEEPEFEVNFNFGSVGIDAQVYDSSTGEKIQKEKVDFTASPSSADSVDEISKIKVSAPDYQPSYVRSFSKFSLNMGFIKMVVIEIGRVELDPEQPPQITVNSSPSGASVYIDGTYKGKTPMRSVELDPGSYEIQLTKDGYHSWSDRVNIDTGEQKTISSNEANLRKKNEPPSASFSFDPESPSTEDEVTFRSQSADKDGRITDYRWSFGDGSKSWGETASHTYREEGRYTVKIEVTDDDGATDTATKTVVISEANQPPSANFTYSPEEPEAGQKLTFDASPSSDSDGTVESFKWDLTGDGTIDKSGSKVTHTYDSKGNYEVKLMVTDDNGATTSTTRQFKVTKPEEDVTIDEKFGLVVGITEYQYEGLNNLSFPAEDAKAFYEFLVEEGGFKEENVTLLTNEEATTYRFDTELKKLATETDKDDLAVIYYSGHGVRGEDAKPIDEKDGYDEYYATYNTDPTDSDSMYETAYRDDEFAIRIKNISTDRIAIFLDSCYSGGAIKTVKGYTPPGQKDFPANSDVFSDFEELDGTALFAASKEGQESFEPHTDKLKEKLGHGVFTYYLLKGLKGEADKNKDGTITIEELESYVSPKVEKFTEENFPASQTPKVKGTINAPLLQEKGKLEGEVKYVKGAGKEEADKGDYVVINLGEEDSVRKEDRFEVLYAAKGVGVIEDLRTEIEITDVAGPQLAVGKVLESGLTVEEGFKVRKVNGK